MVTDSPKQLHIPLGQRIAHPSQTPNQQQQSSEEKYRQKDITATCQHTGSSLLCHTALKSCCMPCVNNNGGETSVKIAGMSTQKVSPAGTVLANRGGRETTQCAHDTLVRVTKPNTRTARLC